MQRVAIICALVLAGCSPPPERDGRADAAPSRQVEAPAPARSEPAEADDSMLRAPGLPPPTAGEVIQIESGVLQAGSVPGAPFRSARTEASLEPVTVPTFSIDRLPYPNDPAQAPLAGKTQQEAAALCADQGKRLCTEVEWERACKGDSIRTFPHGEALDVERCNLNPASCQSSSGVAWLGQVGPEWTSSERSRGLGNFLKTAITRGAAPSAPAGAHRCAARSAADPATTGDETVFRCCQGNVAAPAYPEAPPWRAFRVKAMDDAELRRLLQDVPELAAFASDFRQTGPEDTDRALAQGGLARETVQLSFVEGILKWSPVRGEEIWIIAGRTASASLVAALYPLRDGRLKHAASFILDGETPSMALAFGRADRTEVHFSSCWGCLAEDGSVQYAENGAVVIVQ